MKLQENINQLNKDLTNIGLGLNRAFFQKKPKQKDIQTIGIYVEPVLNSHEMPTAETGYDWYEDVYSRVESNQKPIEATHIELGYEIDRLKKDVAFHKQTLINYQNSTQAQMDDYKNLEVDYRNSQGEVKRLKAKVEDLEGFEQYGLWVIQKYLDLKKQLASVEEKKEVDRTWL